MNKIKIVPLIYMFHSITNLYKGVPEADLTLEVYEYGTDAVEVKLINNKYCIQRNTLQKQFIYFNLCSIIYAILRLFKAIHFLYIDIFLILWFFALIWRISQLVEFEKIIYCSYFGIHLQVRKWMGNNNRYIASSNIHDIVINEVIEDLDFRYLLILRTKGVLFNKNPIICIFKKFRPSCECLCLVYKHLNKVINAKHV